MQRIAPGLCAAFLAVSGAHAATPTEIGTTLSVIDVVTAELSTERRNLTAGDVVRQNEVIEAAQTARSEFKLADDTKLALGPGARLILDKFVYDPGKKSGNIAIDLAKGAFRFMTGVASKPSYVIRVPAASITVRGTIFDVFVQANGAAWLLLHEGGVEVCNQRGNCRVLDEPGKLILVNEDGDVGRPFRWANLDGIQGFSFDEAFPFVGDTPSIDPKPVFTRQALISDPPPPPKSKKKAGKGTKDTDRHASADPSRDVKPIQRPGRKPKLAVYEEEIEEARPPRTGKKPPRVKLPRSKTPQVTLPSDDASGTDGKRRKWRRIAEQAASKWIDRARLRNRDTSDAVGPSFGSAGRGHGPVIGRTFPPKGPPKGMSGHGPTKIGPSGLR